MVQRAALETGRHRGLRQADHGHHKYLGLAQGTQKLGYKEMVVEPFKGPGSEVEDRVHSDDITWTSAADLLRAHLTERGA
jgi:hypothetical protein